MPSQLCAVMSTIRAWGFLKQWFGPIDVEGGIPLLLVIFDHCLAPSNLFLANPNPGLSFIELEDLGKIAGSVRIVCLHVKG